MLRTIRLAFVSASALAFSAGAALADYELHILHINDFHSRVESINKYDSTCSAADEAKNACFGGAARLLTAVNQTRAGLAGKNVLTLNGGDNFQGSLFYSTYKGTVEAEVMNDIKFDAMTLGNHEFDDGEGALATFLEKAQFPVVTANLEADAKSKIAGKIKPYVIVTVGGQKIGIVGAVTEETPQISSPGPDVAITSDVAAITKAVEALKAQGVDKIIALTHVGYERDITAIAKIPDVDVVVGGHSHTLLSNTDKSAAGPYPTMVDNPGGYKVPVVQAASYSKYLGDLTVIFDDKGVVKSAKGDPILVDASFKPDPTLAARVKELGAPLEAMKKKVIGKTETAIDGSHDTCRSRECQMGNLVADAMLDKTRNEGIQIAITNGGGLRASIEGGDVSMGSVLTVLPFQNTIATFKLKGEDIKAALENGVSQIADGAGRFPQVAGLKYSFDASKPVGQRILSVDVADNGGFVPLDPAKTYGVVSNNFMRAGGDGYKIFQDKGTDAYDYGPNLEDVVAAYIGKHSPYKPYTDGRVTVATATETKPATTTTSEAKPAATATETKPAATTTTTEAKPATTTTTEAKPAATSTTEAKPAETTAKQTTSGDKAEAVESSGTKPAETKSSETQQSAETATKPADTGETQTASKETRHTVVKGDTYWDLAKTYYGRGAEWRKIREANRMRPHALTIGAELTIPAK